MNIVDGDFEVRELFKSYHAFAPKDLPGIIHQGGNLLASRHMTTSQIPSTGRMKPNNQRSQGPSMALLSASQSI